MKKTVLLIGLVLLAVAFFNQPPPVNQVIQLNPQEFSVKMKQKPVFVVDVHTPEQTHIPGTSAAQTIIKLGYTEVYDLKGGTNAYQESQPLVALTPATISLGKVIYGEVAKAVFILTNYTPLPLKITRVATSCGCTQAKVEKEELQAYESTPVNVSFDPAVHKDDTDLGDLTRTIYITTDNPNFPDLESTITAAVIRKTK